VLHSATRGEDEASVAIDAMKNNTKAWDVNLIL
jgi:hypothetical protein